MGRRRMMIYALGGAILIMILTVLSLFFTGSANTPPIILPTPAVSGGVDVSPGPGTPGGLTTLDVTKENVQAVIATMYRPDSYSRNITVESVWSSGKTLYNINTWVKGSASKTIITRKDSASYEIVVVTGDYLYIWYDGDDTYYKGKIGETNNPVALADEYQKMPSYEDILALDKSDIMEASYTIYNDEPCIYVMAQSGELGYIYTYYVSINTGLLICAETYDGDTLIYSMNAGSPILSEPPDDIFRLPDGKNALTS